jgi:hypothetical protein
MQIHIHIEKMVLSRVDPPGYRLTVAVIFINNLDNMGNKRCRILRRFQKYKLKGTLVTKRT